MPYNTTRFAIRIPGGIRTLFKVIEKSSGEIIISIKGGTFYGYQNDGAPGPRVLEERYSLHPSPKSKEFNVFKHTLNLEGGRSITTAALTDAIKLKNGFSIVFARRCQRLSDGPAEQPKTNEQTFVLAEYDESMFNLMHAIFVGHPDSNFDAKDPDIIANSFPFRMFQIVVTASLYALPSHSSTELLHSLTLRPEDEEVQYEERRFLMRGRSPTICLEQYRNSVRLLASRFIKLILRTEIDLDPKTVEMLEGDLAKIGEVGLTDIELGPNQPEVHMLTSGPTPIARSLLLHSEFLRRKGKPEGEGG
jgi:hypothetical protein